MKTIKVNRLKLDDTAYPEALRTIASPPKQLFYAGASPDKWLKSPRAAIVGSRKMSPYGEHVTQQLAGYLAAEGVAIISGLALGVDAMAHKAALAAGGIAIAVLPASLDNVYPASHRGLAQDIIDSGGTLLSEYDSSCGTYPANFIARNRIVSGLADVLVITEAAAKSGSLHTARFALDQGKTVMAVPGNINHPGSQGCNNLIKSGALVVTEPGDVLYALGINHRAAGKRSVFRGSQLEESLLDLITSGICSNEELALAANASGSDVNSALTLLEISGHIRSQGGGNWILA